MQKKIAVLLGGTSAERDVSLVTGVEFAKVLHQKRYHVEAIDCAFGTKLINFLEFHRDKKISIIPPRFNTNKMNMNRNVLKTVNYLIKKKFDLIFIALHGGYGENGQLQALLDLCGIPYTGSGQLASGLGMNKHLSKTIFQEAGIPTPPWVHLTNPDQEINQIIKLLGLPLVVKPNDQGSTIGLSIVNQSNDLLKAIHLAFQHSKSVIVEKYIEGQEITASILDFIPLPLIEIIPQSGLYDYEHKYQPGKSQYIVPAPLPAKLTRQIQDYALMAFKTLDCRHYGRVDFRLSPDKKPFCLEINTLPGMTPTSLVPKAAHGIGLDFSELILKIFDLALA
jgi:D-alanine-D-alanine ligase